MMHRFALVFAALLATGSASPSESQSRQDLRTVELAAREIVRRREIFRDDTFGNEDFWGGQRRLHESIAGRANGGVGPGLSPKAALAVGLKVDVDALPADLLQALRKGRVDLTNPATTLALLRLDAVV